MGAKKRNLTPHYCEVCGFDLFIQKHRIVPGREGGRYVQGNVIALCGNCHYCADEGLFERKVLLSIVEHRLTEDYKTKICSICKQTKRISEFNRNKQAVDGRRPHCSECRNQQRRSDYAHNPTKYLEEVSQWNSKNRDKYLLCMRQTNLKRRYGLDAQQLADLLNQQDHNCAICNKPFLISGFHVDHNHATGEVRALLCGACNVALGNLRDDASLIRRAIAYLEGSIEFPYSEDLPLPSARLTGRSRTCRKYDLRTRWGLTLEQYDELWLEQGGVCAICWDPSPEGRNLAIDHDHSTKVIRGLLCDSCNHALGFFKDNIENMQKAIDYLNVH